MCDLHSFYKLIRSLIQLITSPVFEWFEFTKTLLFGLDFLPTGQFIGFNFVTMTFNSKKLTQIYFPLHQADINGIPFELWPMTNTWKELNLVVSLHSNEPVYETLQNKTSPAMDFLKARHCLGSV